MYQQALLQVLVLICIVTVTAGLRPNRYEVVARMEFFSHCVLITTVAMGLMYEESLLEFRQSDSVRERETERQWPLKKRLRSFH